MGRDLKRGALWLGLGLLACAVAAAPGQAGASSLPNQFCTGDPCIISSDKTIDAVAGGLTIDFGTRTVILQRQLTVSTLPSGAVATVTIKAGTFQIVGANGFIKASSTSAPAGTLTIDVVNNILLNGTTSGGDLRLSGLGGGTLTLKTAMGSITGSGRINIYGDGALYSGGTINLMSGGDINLTGMIDMHGNTQGAGGNLEIAAAGNVTQTGFLDISGGQGGGGFIDANIGGSLTLGVEDMSGSGEDADAGIVTIDVGGDVNFTGKITGRGADISNACGDGADIDITAGGDINVLADMDIKGRGLDCTGGFLSLDSNDSIFLQSFLDMGGTGLQGEGGDLDVEAINLIRQTGTVQLDGGDGGAGDFFYLCDNAVEILGIVNANGRDGTSPGSALTEIDAGTLLVSGSIDASGGSATSGGSIDLAACDVTITSTATITSLGQLGDITIEASDTAQLHGHFTAGSGGIEIDVNSKSNPPDTTGAVFSPAPTILLTPALIPCRVCDTNAQCADTNPCTADVCVPATGCSHTPLDAVPCDDGNLCTLNDQCSAGVCVGGPVNTCNDNNQCTTDLCVPGTGCTHTPQFGACDDGDLCTGGDSCATGSCVGTPINCSDSNPCTNDSCSAGVCNHAPNSNPCNDGNQCTTNDTCSGGTCVGGAPPNCADADACTTDSCDTMSGCQHTAIPGCVDTDHDGKIDSEDECTRISWTVFPTAPPNQNPRKFGLISSKLSSPDGEQKLLIKGFFNPATTTPTIDPTANGVHIYAADSLGAIFDVSIPPGPGCGPDDGWSTVGTPGSQTWKYRNQSGALPPGCAAGSASGVTVVQIKDARQSSKQALQFKIKAKDATLLRDPVLPLTRIQVSVALGARPSPTTVSPQAIAGQCAEAQFLGNPIASKGKPFCKARLKNAQIDGAICKGL